jgi:hypothetical protein
LRCLENLIVADSNQNRDAGDAEKDPKGLPAVPPGMGWLYSSMYALGLLVLLVAGWVAFGHLANDKAMTIVLLLLAAVGLAVLPKLIHFLPYVQSFKIGYLEVTLKKIEREFEEQKDKLQATEADVKDTKAVVGDFIMVDAEEKGLVGSSKKSRAHRASGRV